MNPTFDASPDAAVNFLVSQRAYIEPTVYEIKYPENQYDTFLHIDSNAGEWTPTVNFMTSDGYGEMDFIGPGSNDINRANVGYAMHAHNISSSALGYGYTLEEINVARLSNIRLDADRAKYTMRSSEQFINKLSLLGGTNKKTSFEYDGLFTNSSVSKEAGANLPALISAATDIAGAQAVVTFFQSKIDKVYYDNTNYVFAPNAILVPYLSTLSSAILPFGGNMTLLQYLETNLRAGNGGAVKFYEDFNLRGIGAGNADRMMVGRIKDEEVAKLHLPMSPKFQQMYQDGPMSWFIPLLMRTGGTEVRVPKAFHYVDGVFK